MWGMRAKECIGGFRRFCRTIVIGASSVCFWFCVSPGAAFAQAQPSAADVWSQATLSGDWSGVRTDLERRGITFSLNYTVELLSNLRGGIRQGSVANDLFQPQIEIDAEKLWGWQGAKFRGSGIVTHGPGLTPGFVGNLMTVSNIEAGPVGRLFELWYAQSFFNELWTTRIGLMRAEDFMSSDTASSAFMNNTFGWNTLFGTALPGGGPDYPLSAPGAQVRVKPAKDVYLQAAVFSGDPSGGNGSNQGGVLPTGTVFSFSGGAFFIGEMAYTPNQEKDAKGLPGAYKLGAWYHTSSRFGDQRFDTFGLSLADPLSSGMPREHAGNFAIYGVLDQMFYRVPGTEDQGLSGFLRVTGSPGDRNLVNFYLDAGLVYTGLIPGRPADKLGLGVAYARIGDHARYLDRDTAFFTASPYPTRSAEALIEATYRAKLAPWWIVQGDVQYLVRPSGGVLNDDGSARKNAWVVGLRSAVSF